MRDEMAFHLEARTAHWREQGLSAGRGGAARPARVRRRRSLQGRMPAGARLALARRAARRPGLRRRGRCGPRRCSPSSPWRSSPSRSARTRPSSASSRPSCCGSCPSSGPASCASWPGSSRPIATWQMRYDGSTQPGGRRRPPDDLVLLARLHAAPRSRDGVRVAVPLRDPRRQPRRRRARAAGAGAAWSRGLSSTGSGRRPIIGRGHRARRRPRRRGAGRRPEPSLWQSAFGGDPRVLGRTVRVNATPAVVVGVAAPRVRGPASRADRSTCWCPSPASRPRSKGRTGRSTSGAGRSA